MVALLTAAALLLVGLSINERQHDQSLYNGLVEQHQQLFGAVYRLDSESQANLAADYSYWDDLVKFARKPTQKFAVDNLVTSLDTFQVNAIWVMNSKGAIVYQTNNLDSPSLDLGLKAADLPGLFAKGPLTHFFVRTNQGLVEVRAATIHPSNDPKRLTPQQGYLLVGRVYDLAYRQRLGSNLKSTINLVGSETVTNPEPSTGQVVLTKALSDQHGKTVAQLVATSDAPSIRELYLQSSKRLQNFVMIVIPALLILFWFLTREVAEPLRRISTSLAKRDSKPLGNLTDDQTEFGQIAALVEQDLRQNRQQLEAVHARLRASINSINIGFIMTDAASKIIIVNDAARKILFNDVHRAKEVSMAELEQLFPKAGLQHTIDQAIKSNSSHNMGEVIYGEKFLRLFVAPITEKPGQPPVLGSIALFEDVTLERSLKRARDEFFSIASHELRTPLTVIMGNAAMIEENIVPDIHNDQLAGMTKDIYDSSHRLIQMVNDFLDTSRLEQNRIKFEITHVDLIPLAKDLVKEYSSVVKKQGIELKLETLAAQTKVLVRADQDKLRQVLINLLSNALTFTHRGSITLRIESHPDYARVFVTDTGEGIPATRHNLLFKKFQQAEENILSRNNSKDLTVAKDTTHGTGLGLYISKLLMEGMGGLIRLEKSEVGQGTTFSVTLPAAKSLNPKGKSNG